ncbi:MAG: nuclear transport factor 2 family protein [Burkholderiaceae bacterium]
MKDKLPFNSIAFKKAFENLKDIENLDDVLSFYDEKCYFKDPFHNIQSKSLMRKLFVNMFQTVNNPRFTDLKMLSDGSIIVLSWTFIFERKGKKIQNCIKGSSWIQVNEKGYISHHHDYWDSVELFLTFKLLRFPLQFIKTIFSKAQVR